VGGNSDHDSSPPLGYVNHSAEEATVELGGRMEDSWRNRDGEEWRLIFDFDGSELDLDRYELRRDGAVVRTNAGVRPAHPAGAAAAPGRDQEEILDEIWGDRFVSESALTAESRRCGGPRR
jgi:hypothetical protein